MIRHVSWRALPLAALLLWAPLPFASASPHASMALFLFTLVALALAFLFPSLPVSDTVEADVNEAGCGRQKRGRNFLLVAIAALVAIALLGWLQSLAWPGSLVRAVAPEVAALARQAAEISGEDKSGDRAPLSLAVESSRSAAFDWLLPAAAALAAARVGASRRVRRTLLGALVLSAMVQIAIGVELWIARTDSLWGVTLAHFPGRLRGSFVNPNHLSLFLEIALVAIFAWTWWCVRRAWLEAPSAEARLLRVGPAALAFLLVFAGIVLTASRAGVLAVVGALAVQGLLVGSRRGRTWLLGAGLVAALGGVAFVTLVGVEGALGRLVSTPLEEIGGGSRFRAAFATLDLWQLSPITGVGLGAFRATFPLVQPETLAGFWRHAHSDWIELLATTGLVGAAIFLLGLGSYVRGVKRVIRNGDGSEARAAGIAAAGALVVVGLHSMVDFGLTMPANGLALAVLLGAAAAARTRPAT